MATAITDPQFKGIGKIIVRWAQLEYYMIEAARSMLGISSSDTAALFWHMGYADRRDRLGALFEFREPDDKLRRHFESIMGRMDDCYDFRNTVAHSVWKPSKTRGAISPIAMRLRGTSLKIAGFNMKELHISASLLEAEAKKSERLAEDFKQFFVTHFRADFSKSTPRKSKK